MIIPVRIVITSHLSDIQHSLGIQSEVENINIRIEFVKWLIFQYSENLSQLFDPEAEYEKFLAWKNKII
jgi:hypothetical protein